MNEVTGCLMWEVVMASLRKWHLDLDLNKEKKAVRWKWEENQGGDSRYKESETTLLFGGTERKPVSGSQWMRGWLVGEKARARPNRALQVTERSLANIPTIVRNYWRVLSWRLSSLSRFSQISKTIASWTTWLKRVLWLWICRMWKKGLH